MDKPALLRRLFQLGSDYSGQVLSYQKMLGQLQEAGNTTTLAHYLELLATAGTQIEVFYWRERNREVDFVVRSGKRVVGIEVKSGRKRKALPGLEAFSKAFRPHRLLLVGAQGIPLEEFLLEPATVWVEA